MRNPNRTTSAGSSRGWQAGRANPQGLRWHRVSWWWFGFLALLLVLPGLGLHRLSQWIDGRVLVAVPLVGSVFAFFLYRHDKKRAIEDGWRVPESMLHLVEVLGGWPGALLGQRVFRHKSSKVSYQFAFWGIVIVYEIVALDFLRDWEFARQGLWVLRGWVG
jgi:uncharacterized membrane protein YsdA (DUF1294 family)